MQQKPVDDDVAKLQHMAREFALGFNTKDVDRIMRFYGEKYFDVNLRNPVQTKAERSEYCRKAIERLNSQVEVEPDEIPVEGDFAFVRGTIRLRSVASEGSLPATKGATLPGDRAATT